MMAAEIGPFTPIPHSLAQEVGLVCAAVYGLVWRYCQMKEGVCKASLDTLGSDINIDRATVMRSIKKLCELGYLIDQTPDRRNAPHTYILMKSVALCNSTDDKGVVMRNSLDGETVAHNNSSISVAERKATVAESHLKRDLRDSLTPKGVVGKPTAPVKEKLPGPLTKVKEAFEELTNLKTPTAKGESKAWWGWYGQILEAGGKDADRAIKIIRTVIKHMDASGLAINKPKSIVDSCRAVAAGRSLGKNGSYNNGIHPANKSSPSAELVEAIKQQQTQDAKEIHIPGS